MISFVVFSALLPVAHWASDASWSTIILQPLYGLAGSSVLGIAAAYGLHTISLKTHEAGQYKLALVIGVMMIVIGIAGALKLSMLFVPLAVGVTIRSLERTTVISDLEFGAAFELFFIILFVFAGAGLHIRELLHYAPAVLAVVGVRIAMKLAGVTSVLVLGRRPFRTAAAGGLLLIPMAGLAIGLAQTTGLLFPHYTAAVSAIVLGAVTVFETIGPPIASLAFRLAGESEEVRQRKEERSEAPVETEIPTNTA
jgi:Kef-type K+ transport system membrane component KefB